MPTWWAMLLTAVGLNSAAADRCVLHGPCVQIRGLYMAGHEIATHTIDHVGLPNATEILGAKLWLNQVGGFSSAVQRSTAAGLPLLWLARRPCLHLPAPTCPSPGPLSHRPPTSPWSG